jgi:hypothetical protein
MAQHPTRVFRPHHFRQSRPLWPWMAGGLGRVLAIVVPGKGGPYYLAFVLLNLLVVAASVWLLDYLLTTAGVPPTWAVGLSLVLMANFVTRHLILTPHQQMFILLTPLAAVWLGLVFLRPRPVWVWAVASLGCGVGLLAYGNVVLVWPVLLLAALLARSPVRLIAVLVGFMLPSLIWIAVVRAVAGSYYNAEMERYRQFVWLMDVWRTGELAMIARNLRAFGDTLLTVHIWPILAAAAVAAWWVPWRQPVVWLTGLTFVVTGGLLGALGYYAPRLTFTLVPLCVLLIGIGAARALAPSTLLPHRES